MNPILPPMLALFDLSRAPLLLVLGLALVVCTWRVTCRFPGAGRRLMMTGALLLGAGYGLLIPLQESGLLAAGGHGHDHGHGLLAHGGFLQLAKPVVMNLGWLLLGGGLALHVRASHIVSPIANPQPEKSRESIA